MGEWVLKLLFLFLYHLLLVPIDRYMYLLCPIKTLLVCENSETLGEKKRFVMQMHEMSTKCSIGYEPGTGRG